MTTLKARLEKRLVDARSCDSDTYHLIGSAYETVIEELIRAVEALEERAYPEPGVVVPWIHNLLADIEKGIVG